jgi:hypothetical protein
MAKQLTEQELRKQAVEALSDRLGPSMRYVSSLLFLASPLTTSNGGENTFRVTASMNCWKKVVIGRATSNRCGSSFTSTLSLDHFELYGSFKPRRMTRKHCSPSPIF